MARDPIVKRKYAKTQIPGILGHQQMVDTTGMEPDMKKTLGLADTTQVKPKKKGFNFGKFVSGLVGGKK